MPRHRTELLVDEAERLLSGRPGAPLVVDLCCGSGALGAALAVRRTVRLYAADVDAAAVRCARVNVAAAGGVVVEGDLFDPLPPALRGHVEVLMANVPYVPSDAIALMPPEARDHETRATLDGGADGLEVMRRVAAGGAGVAGRGRDGAVRVQRAAGRDDVRGARRRGPGAAGGGVRGPRCDGGDRAPGVISTSSISRELDQPVQSTARRRDR